ncbi:MAG TPA: hypothetical protein VGF61_25165, partial [Candidatus Acidoferrum sp.]
KRRCAWKSRKKRGIPTFPQPQQQQTFGYISNVSTTPAKVTFLDGLTGTFGSPQSSPAIPESFSITRVRRVDATRRPVLLL